VVINSRASGQLIQRLAKSRAGVALDDLAADLEVVRRTVYRDLDALMLAGFPVVSRSATAACSTASSTRSGSATCRSRPTRSSRSRSARTSARARGHGLPRLDPLRAREDPRRARPELADYLARLGARVPRAAGPHKSYAHLRETIRTLNDAVLAQQQREDPLPHRPHGRGLVAHARPVPRLVPQRRLYVVGHDHKSASCARSRSTGSRAIEATAALRGRADFDFERYIGASFGVIAEPATRVRILFEPRWASYVAERTWHPSQKLTPRERGRVELAMEVGGTDELRTWILSFGDGALVLEPPALRDAVARELGLALARYRVGGSTEERKLALSQGRPRRRRSSRSARAR
jgi:hypothetical protein